MKYLFYITNHGFGHASRNVPVIEELLRRDSRNEVLIKTDKLRAEFLQRNLWAFEDRIHFYTDCNDVGMILYPGTLVVDVVRLEREIRADQCRWPEYIAREERFIKNRNPDLVIADIIPWALKAAHRCDVPGLLLSSFTWVENYRRFFGEDIWKPYLTCYQQASYALWYDLHSDEVHSYCSSYGQISLISRKGDPVKAAEIRAKHRRPIIFITVGKSADLDKKIDVSGLPYVFYTTGGIDLSGDNVFHLPEDMINTMDYIMASEYVIAKGGWSTVAEILLLHKKSALIFRNNLSEDECTRHILERRGHCITIGEHDLYDMAGIIHRLDFLSEYSSYPYKNDLNKIMMTISQLQEGGL